MALLADLKSAYKTISVVGMAKNAGKTTTLNHLIEEAADENLPIGVTSTGRDGESIDLVTGTDKPSIYLYPGTIVSVPTGLFESASAGLEILRATQYYTALGQVLLCRVVDGGEVQVAGPVLTSEHRTMTGDMLRFGAEMVLIDGAVDRKSIAAPETSDAIILATGAVLSRNIQKVAEETAHVAGLYRLSVLDDEQARALFKEKKKITLVGKGKAVELDVKTGLGAGAVLSAAIETDTAYAYIPGALTGNLLQNINPKKLPQVTFVAGDPTKIFLGANEWQALRKKGLRVKVLRNITIAGISVNPVSPEGYAFEREKLLEVMGNAVPGVRIIDVKM